MKKFLKYVLLVILSSFLTNCEMPINQEPFDKELWNKQFDFGYTHREEMLVDLANNHLRLGMTQTEIVKLLGQPNKNPTNVKPSEHAYFLNEEYSWPDIDPTVMKYLILSFKIGSTLNGIYKRTRRSGKGTENKELVLTSSPI
ncbi:hypothetical protein [Fulvivirga sp.]|uniref:hypothetical protein n=1 Tax=Fulvivirga sp. TaxID=1931237 RepID=UPI0032ED447B